MQTRRPTAPVSCPPFIGYQRAMRPVLAAFILAACAPLPDTVGEAPPSDTVFALVEVNGAPAGYPATLRLLADNRVQGAGPCGPFTGRQEAPLPFVEFTRIDALVRGCDQSAEQEAFFLLLRAMDFAEDAGDSLLLSNAAGQSLFFRRATGPNT